MQVYPSKLAFLPACPLPLPAQHWGALLFKLATGPRLVSLTFLSPQGDSHGEVAEWPKAPVC